MTTFNFHNQLKEDLVKGVHVWGTHALVLALTTNANMPVATNSVLANLTQVSYTNLSSRAVTTTSATQTSGTLALVLVDTVLTASGAVATFRGVELYNDTPTSPADPLIGWMDYGSDLTMSSGQTLTVDWNGAGAITLT